MSPHILPLSTLHAAAPGVLDVIFGPDGDFEGAPLWRGPVRMRDGRYVSMDWLLCQPWDIEIMYRAASLDPLVPTVAARLAGLCARALGAPDLQTVVFVGDSSLISGGRSVGRVASIQTAISRYDFATSPLLRSVVTLPADAFTDRATFLAALTLALAPQIAALKETTS